MVLHPDRRLARKYQSCDNTLLGGYHEGPITLAIDEDMIRDNAGCTARYSANGPELAHVGGAISTLAVTRPDGFAFNDEGRLVLRTNRGLLTMCRKGSPPPFGG